MATDIDKCQFCKKETGDLLACFECEVRFCEDCNTNVHSKIKVALNHTVFNVNESSEEEKPNADDFRDQKEKVTKCLEKIEEDLPHFQEQLKSMKDMEEKYETIYNEMKEKILAKKEKMKDMVTGQALKLIEELDEWWKLTKQAITMETQALSRAEEDLGGRKRIAEEALKSDAKWAIMSAATHVLKPMPQKMVPCIEITKPIKFSTAGATQKIVIGSIVQIPKLIVAKSIPCDVTSILTTVGDVVIGYNEKTFDIKYLVITTSDKCFCYRRRYTMKGWNNGAITYKGEMIGSMAVDIDKQLICSFRGTEKRPFLLSKDEPYQFDYLFPNKFLATAVYHNRQDRYIVGYASQNTFELSDDDTRGIMIFNNNKNLLQDIQMKEVEDKPFTFAIDLTTNINGDICVVDQLKKDGNGRLLVFDKWVQYKWQFTGLTESEDKKDFFPEHVTTSSIGNIFVSDTEGHRVFMLSMNGDYLTSIGEEEGIEEPSGLCVNPQGQLLIGCPGILHIVEIDESGQ